MEDDGDGEARDGGAGLVGEREVHDDQLSQCNARQYRIEVRSVKNFVGGMNTFLRT